MEAPIPYSVYVSELPRVRDLNVPMSVDTGPGHTEKATVPNSVQYKAANRNQTFHTESVIFLAQLAHDKVQRGL
jgi:hypothetical protein